MLKSKTMNNLFRIEVMFYGKLLYLLIYIYIYTHTHTYIHIYIYKIMVIPKRYTGVDWYRNILFH